jgi:putative endonuclease
MSKHNEIGTNGELIAVNFLKNKGYLIVATNWRSGKKEIDIIAEIGDNIVFVEVKTRSNFDFGYPEEAVNERKKNLIKSAAEDYFFAFPSEKQLRFDIISILQRQNKALEIVHIEDAFY